MKYPNLFSPVKIKGLELRNRVVLPGMGTNYTAPGSYMNDRTIDYHVARARGGNGLNTTEITSVHTPSAPKYFLSISDDKFIPGLKKFTDAIHEAGGKACVQLWQGGVVAKMMDPETVEFVPSDMTVNEVIGTPIPEMTVRAADKEMIKEVVKAFGQAARRAVEAGFDTVEFHAAHGYSPHEFLSAAFNKRTDEYGGTLENRARFLLECIREIRGNIPEDMPLIMRVDAHDDYVENGLTIEEVIAFCKMAEEAGVDALNVSRGNPITLGMKYEVPPIDIPKGFNVDNAARIKKETGMITIATGRINDPQMAEDMIADGKVDMVVIGRGQLADPEFCNKAYAGDDESIIRCVGCNQGCIGANGPMTCTRNPALGREKEFALIKTDSPKKVLVAGGGMAGLEAAITLKQRGHKPVLFEEGDRLGGQFFIAGLAPRKAEMREAAISRGRQAARQGVDIRLSTTVTASVLDEVRPEAVIIATGANPIKLDIPGAELPHVAGCFDVLNGEVCPEGNVMVVGGGLVGLEVAECVAQDGNKVTVLEMLDQAGKDLENLRKMCVLESLRHSEVNILVNTKCVEIKESSVIVERGGKNEELMCDYVVIAVGSKSRDYSEIKLYCEEKNIPYYVIGDAKKARKVIDAIAEAAEIARAI